MKRLITKTFALSKDAMMLGLMCALFCLTFSCTESDFEDNAEVPMAATRAGTSDRFYYYGGEKIYLTERTDKLLVRFAPDAAKESLSSLVGSHSIDKSLSSIDNRLASGVDSRQGGLRYAVLEISDRTRSTAAIESFKSAPDVVSVSYLHQYNNSPVLQGITDEFVVKLKETTTYAQLQELAGQYGCTIGKENEFVKNQFMLYASATSRLDAMQTANLFYETGLFEFAEPNFLLLNTKTSSDGYFYMQWGLKNVGFFGGTWGMDIRAEEAWAITKGSPNIKVAVIDDGVESGHPDLQGNMIAVPPGYVLPPDPYPIPGGGPNHAEDNHGTMVAGIIGALQNNIVAGYYEGISGVAPECKIMSIRVYDGPNTDPDWVANGIHLAVQNGADVINISATYGSPYQQILTAINRATTEGRGGKGCVVVASANRTTNGTLLFPANLPNVIAVGAVNDFGRPTLVSGTGPDLDIMAPGVNIITTDRRGNAGENPAASPAGDYNLFSGTSAAAPHVSGVAALMLSRFPHLTASEVKRRIKASATPLPGGANNVGAGLVNAREAIRGTYLEELSLTPAIDYVIINESSCTLDGPFVILTGKLGGVPTTFINNNPDSFPAGETFNGFPEYPGINITAAPGTPITDLRWEMDFSAYQGKAVVVQSALGHPYGRMERMNFVPGEQTISYSLSETTTVPFADRLTLYIYIHDYQTYRSPLTSDSEGMVPDSLTWAMPSIGI